MSLLIVVAHPDDEVLGCGGLALGERQRGRDVHSCILSGDVQARRGRPSPEHLTANMLQAHRLLDLPDPQLGAFPNIAFNTVPHLRLVQFIEGVLSDTRATRVVTHHPHDLNDDHRQVSIACQAAARLSQRLEDVPPLEVLLYMEIQSSTDWAFPGTERGFEPTAFYPMTDAMLRRKLEALECYNGVMRPPPHPRSADAIQGLAHYRGGQAGVTLAEAYQVAYLNLEDLSA